MQNNTVVISAIKTSVNSTTAASDTAAALRKGIAKPAISAPRAIALATSKPLRKPPEAIKGTSGSCSRILAIQSAVGIPQSPNVCPKRRCKEVSARSLSTIAQDVPPAPATSIACTPTAISFSAIVAEIPLPTSLAITGTGKSLHKSDILSSNP